MDNVSKPGASEVLIRALAEKLESAGEEAIQAAAAHVPSSMPTFGRGMQGPVGFPMNRAQRRRQARLNRRSAP